MGRLINLAVLAVLLIVPIGRARAAGIDPEALKIAHQLLVEMHATATQDQMVRQMMTAMGTGINAVNPGKGKEVEELLTEVLVPEMKKIQPELIDAAANIYAANFTAAELKQMVDFYQSDIGRKLVQRLPILLQEQGRISQQIIMKIAPEIQERVQKALIAHGLNRPKSI